jgi:hypothetical protein
MAVQLNKELFNSRLAKIYNSWKVIRSLRIFSLPPIHANIRFQNASEDVDYSSISSCDALFLCAGDPAGEDEPIPKGTAFQVSVIDIFD